MFDAAHRFILRMVRSLLASTPCEALGCGPGSRADQACSGAQLQRRRVRSRSGAQVISDGACVRTRDGKPLEAVITEGFAHAGVVNTLAHVVVPARRRVHDSAGSGVSGLAASPVLPASRPASAPVALPEAAEVGPVGGTRAAAGAETATASGSGLGSGVEGCGLSGEAWLLLEYCDKGCLQACTPA